MTDGDDAEDPVATARRHLETSIERPERALGDREEILDLLSATDGSTTRDRRLARRAFAAGALANLAHHDPDRLTDAAPTLATALRTELDRGGSADDPAVRERSRTIREHLLAALGRLLLADADALADPDDLAAVARAASADPDDDAVRTATRALFAVAGDHPERLVPAVDALGATLDHPDDAVAARVVGTLGRLAAVAPEAVAATVPALRPLLDRDDEAVRHNAVEALGVLVGRRPAAVAPLAPSLSGLLTADSTAIQHNAAAVLGVLADDHPEAVRPAAEDLRALRDHDDAAVRRVAAGAVARVGRADAE